MDFVFTDRESAYPNKYLVTPETGNPYYVILERADEPVVAGTPLNAETFNTLIADLVAMAEDAGIPLPSKATVGQYVRVKAVDENGEITETETANAVENIPVTVDDAGYTDISGLRQATDVSVVKSGSTITVTTTLQGDVSSVSKITLDENEYPVSITTDGVACAVSWEGFEDG